MDCLILLKFMCLCQTQKIDFIIHKDIISIIYIFLYPLTFILILKSYVKHRIHVPSVYAIKMLKAATAKTHCDIGEYSGLSSLDA